MVVRNLWQVLREGATPLVLFFLLGFSTLFVVLTHKVIEGDTRGWDEALLLNDRLDPLHAALFSDASPGPTKYALSRLKNGFPAGLRLPMTPPSSESRRAVDAALEHAGLA